MFEDSKEFISNFFGLGSGGKKSRGAKMQVLRKQLEESKARQVFA